MTNVIYMVKVINNFGKFDGYYSIESPKKEAKEMHDGGNFYICYQDTYRKDGSVVRELIGSWGNPIAYQRYLGITKL